MRKFRHLLCPSKNGKSAVFRVVVEDRFGKKTINFTFVMGWRKELALKHLAFESEEWNRDVARAYVGLQALKCAKDEYEATKFISDVKSLGSMEVHFWANMFLTNDRTRRAWRAFYG